MLKQIKNTQAHIEYLESCFILASPKDREFLRNQILSEKKELNKLEDKYYLNK